VTYLRLSRDRARLVLHAAKTAAARDNDSLDIMAVVAQLRDYLADYPPDGYAHHPLGS